MSSLKTFSSPGYLMRKLKWRYLDGATLTGKPLTRLYSLLKQKRWLEMLLQGIQQCLLFQVTRGMPNQHKVLTIQLEVQCNPAKTVPPRSKNQFGARDRGKWLTGVTKLEISCNNTQGLVGWCSERQEFRKFSDYHRNYQSQTLESPTLRH